MFSGLFLREGNTMKEFLRLYLKDYAAKILSIPLFMIAKGMQIILSLFSIVYRLLKFPVIGFCMLAVLVELTSDPIRYSFVISFFIVGIIAILYRRIEPFIYNFMLHCSARLKERIYRPVRLKTNVKFTF